MQGYAGGQCAGFLFVLHNEMFFWVGLLCQALSQVQGKCNTSNMTRKCNRTIWTK
jgi:hypothetical protein